MPSRRAVLAGACAALALLALEPTAQARTPRSLAPRHGCAHTGCRFHRPDPDGLGICGLSLATPALFDAEVRS